MTAEAVAEVLGELRRLRDEQVPAAELGKGRRSMVQRVVEQCERTSSLAQVYGDIFRYGLPADELAQLVRGVQQSQPEALQRAAQHLLVPDHPTVVLVGDRQKIEARLRRLALPVTFEVRGEDGAPVGGPVSAACR